MALPNALRGDQWSNKTGRAILPILVWCARNGRTVTYSDLDRELVRRKWGHHVMAVVYGHPAGAVGRALIETEASWGRPIPPLNALVVNKGTGLPGKGCDNFIMRHVHLDKSLIKITQDERKSLVEELFDEIFAFEDWERILDEYGLPHLDETPEFAKKTEHEDVATPSKGGWSGEPESEFHEQLKKYVTEHPHVVGLSHDFPIGRTEYLFPSADRADVVFSDDRTVLGVEVKARDANKHDISRGLFQCVKYQALLRAEQKAKQVPPTARAVLVSEKPVSDQLQNLADLIGISVIIVRDQR